MGSLLEGTIFYTFCALFFLLPGGLVSSAHFFSLSSSFTSAYRKGLSALLVPQVLPKSNFGPSTFFSLKLASKHLIRSTYHP
jgi:uncharacterized membrane protein YjjB (DUF3815 family)